MRGPIVGSIKRSMKRPVVGEADGLPRMAFAVVQNATPSQVNTTWSEPILSASYITGIVITINGTPVTGLASATISPSNTIVYTFNETVVFGDAVLISYTPGDYTNAELVAVEAFSNRGVSNSLYIAPDAFTVGQWLLDDAVTGDALDIEILSLPVANGSTITDIEYELDNSASWVSSGGTGDFTISGLTEDQLYSVQIRAVNATGPSADSDAKTATPTAVPVAPSAFTAGQWSWTDPGSDGDLNINVLTLPDDGGSAILDLEYALDAGAYTSLGAATTGTYQISGLTNGQSYDCKIRAVNAIGNAPDSDIKSQTPTDVPIPVDGDIIAVEILGAAATADGRLNGFAADITIKGWAGQIGSIVYDFGYDANNDPTANTPTLDVVSEGYDNTGTLGTIARSMYLGEGIRKPYPLDAEADERVSGADLIVRVSTTEYVYDDDKNGGAGTSGTDPVISIPAGVFNNGVDDSNALSNFTCTNSSTLDYPKAFGRWLWPDRQIVSGDFVVEFSAHSRFGMNGKPVACVEFDAEDESLNTSATQTITQETLSTQPTKGNPVAAYIATIPAVNLDDTETLEVNATIYPWVGDADSIFDTRLSADGDADSAIPGPQYYINNKSGGYGLSWAVVDGTGGAPAVSGISEADAATTPYATINAAINALKSYNNTNYGRNTTDGSVIALTDDVTHAWPTSVTASNTDAYMIIKTRDGDTTAGIDTSGGSNSIYNGWVKIDGADFNSADVGALRGNETTGKLWLHGIDSFIDSNTTAPIYQWDEYSITNTNVADLKSTKQFSTNRGPIVLCRGNNFAAPVSECDIAVYCVIGNVGQCRYATPLAITGSVINDMAVMGFNQTKHTGVGLKTYSNENEYSAVIGHAYFSNVLEQYGTSGQPLFQIFADNNLLTSDQIIVCGNTFVGERTNWLYNDIGTASVQRRNARFAGNSNDSYNIKTDTFGTPSSNRTGNWGPDWKVGTSYVQADESFGFDGEFDGIDYVTGAAGFVGNNSESGSNTGGGDYTPDTGSILLARIPFSGQYNRYDVFGTERKNNGDIGGIETQ